MKPEFEQRLQAWVDGELDAAAAQEVEALVARDAEARALGENLRSLSDHLRAHEPAPRCPESPEFYWSQIRRGIEAEESRSVAGHREGDPVPARGLRGWLAWLLPVGAAAAAVVMLSRPDPGTPSGGGRVAESETPAGRGAVATMVGHEIEDPDAGGLETLTFYSAQESMTVVWLASADVL